MSQGVVTLFDAGASGRPFRELLLDRSTDVSTQPPRLSCRAKKGSKIEWQRHSTFGAAAGPRIRTPAVAKSCLGGLPLG